MKVNQIDYVRVEPPCCTIPTSKKNFDNLTLVGNNFR